MKQLDVFITSTCYDLIDLRAELAQFLHERGFLVRLSDDPMSDFSVEPTADSIESCLANVEAADVLVCVIDRRYGRPLTSGEYQSKSATHAEVEHARSLSPPKPVFFFLRDKAAADYGFLRDNPTATTRWVEEKDSDQRKCWSEFVGYVSKLPKHEGFSNWYDPFRDVVELKRLVLKRLSDRFPQAVASLALAPDRLVRVTFVAGRVADRRTIFGHFHNVGVGPALNLIHGCAHAPLVPATKPSCRGGLAEGERIQAHDGADLAYDSVGGSNVVLFCEYENRFGDRYRVEQRFSIQSADGHLQPEGVERLYVATSRMADTFQWRQVYPISDS